MPDSSLSEKFTKRFSIKEIFGGKIDEQSEIENYKIPKRVELIGIEKKVLNGS